MELYQGEGWDRVAEYVGGSITAQQCLQRWRTRGLFSPAQKIKRKWSNAEVSYIDFIQRILFILASCISKVDGAGAFGQAARHSVAVEWVSTDHATREGWLVPRRAVARAHTEELLQQTRPAEQDESLIKEEKPFHALYAGCFGYIHFCTQ